MCQRPRCWYFRNGMGLMAKTQRRQVDGGRRRQPLRRDSRQRRTGATSSAHRRIAPALIAYGAKIRIYSAKAAGSGVRELPLEKFFVTPKSANQREHDLKPDEMVIELIVPPPPQNLKTASYEVRQRAAFDWPLRWPASRSRWTATP